MYFSANLWVSKNGLAKNWREVHPHAKWFINNPLNTTNGYTHKPPLLYRFRIFYCSPYFWNQTVWKRTYVQFCGLVCWSNSRNICRIRARSARRTGFERRIDWTIIRQISFTVTLFVPHICSSVAQVLLQRLPRLTLLKTTFDEYWK